MVTANQIHVFNSFALYAIEVYLGGATPGIIQPKPAPLKFYSLIDLTIVKLECIAWQQTLKYQLTETQHH